MLCPLCQNEITESDLIPNPYLQGNDLILAHRLNPEWSEGEGCSTGCFDAIKETVEDAVFEPVRDFGIRGLKIGYFDAEYFCRTIESKSKLLLETQYTPLRRCQSGLSMLTGLPALQTCDFPDEEDDIEKELQGDLFLTNLEVVVWDHIFGLTYGKSGNSIREGVHKNKAKVFAALRRFVDIEILEKSEKGYRPNPKYRKKSSDDMMKLFATNKLSGTEKISGADVEPI